MNLTKNDLICLTDNFNYISYTNDKKFASIDIRIIVSNETIKIIENPMWQILTSNNNILSNLSN